MVFRAVYAAALVSLCLVSGSAHGQRNRGKEFRSLNTDVYQLSIQKDGKIDILLADARPLVFDAFPALWLASERRPETLEISGYWTERYPVDDRFGRGQGMRMRYKNCEWSFRAYPGKPYLVVQVAYVNTGKKPVEVKALIPFAVGAPEKGALLLGPGTPDAPILADALGSRPRLLHGEAVSEDVIAVYNRPSRQSFIAGFTTQERARTHFEIGKPGDEEEPAFGMFRAVCTYDPPVTVAPGDRLVSEVLYLALGESDPLVGLERFARAVAVANGLSARKDAAAPHAWAVELGPDFAHSMTALPPVDVSRAQWGIDSVVLLPGPEAPPEAVRGALKAIDAPGYAPGLWLTSSDALDQQNSDVPPLSAVYNLSLRDAGDEARPDALTQVERDRNRLTAVRATLPAGARIFASSSSLFSALNTDGAVVRASSPDRWRRSPFGMETGSGDLIVDAVQRFHMSSHLQPQAMLVDAALQPPSALRAQLTAASLLGSGLLLKGFAPEDRNGVLRRVLPVAGRPARPLDLFRNERPRVLYLPGHDASGDTHVLAVFNWGQGRDEVTTLAFGEFSRNADDYFTVYDFWNEAYLGTARGRIEVTVPPAGVTVLVLRPYRERPIVLRPGRNVAQSTPRVTEFSWEPREHQLRIGVSGDADESVSLPLLLPQGWSIGEVTEGSAIPRSSEDERVVTLDLRLDSDGSGSAMLRMKLGD